jgi:hypothetical protein
MAGMAAFRDRRHKTLRPYYPRLDAYDNAKKERKKERKKEI